MTLIVAVLNRVEEIQRCLDSVSRQTCDRKQLVVIDGGSTDGTVDLLARNARAVDCWESGPDRGIYQAWNRGLEKARGEWIGFIGADDYLWNEEVLANLVPRLEGAGPRHRIVYGDIAVTSPSGRVVSVLSRPWDDARTRIHRTMSVPHTAMMHHRSIFEEHGRFDESFRIMGDYELLLRALRSTEPLHVPGLVMAAWQQGGLSTSFSSCLLIARERRRALAANDFSVTSFASFWMVCEEAGRSLIRSLLGDWVFRKAQRIYHWAVQR